MSGLSRHATQRPSAQRQVAIGEPPLVRRLLIGAALAVVGLFLVLPLVAVFAQAFQKGLTGYIAALSGAETQAAILLTILTASLVVPLNALFGLAGAWAISKFQFPGKSVLVTVIDLPFSISPVISGLVFVLLFGARGLLGPWLSEHGLKIVFAFPGIVLATTFVTLPFVARELIPLMEAQGTEEEEAALLLGASGWQTLLQVTLPNIKWGLLYGIILCNARAMGEFGAVSVVSGRIRGATNTIPLQAEVLYNEYNFVGAFAVASVLALLALLTLALRRLVVWQSRRLALAAADAPEREG